MDDRLEFHRPPMTFTILYNSLKGIGQDSLTREIFFYEGKATYKSIAYFKEIEPILQYLKQHATDFPFEINLM
ncbi:MAG: hypothetical protein KF824_07795 [Fimbriimonadaceae bacterium]|nr:MAG: hypothetical protein KF824_07795 [Fimbriimonadaceae bacterium]